MEPSKQNPKPNGSLAQQQSLLASFQSQGVPGPELPEEESATLPDEPWPEPEALGGKLPPVHKLTLEMLPTAFRPIVADITERLEVPFEFAAMAVMVTFAGMVNRRAYIQPKEQDPWRVVPNLWGGIVAEPGSRKSAVLEAVMNLRQLS